MGHRGMVFIVSAVLLLIPLTSGSLDAGMAKGESDQKRLSRLCGQCHSLKIGGTCVAGGCRSPRNLKETAPRAWGQFLAWARDGFGCPLSSAEIEALTRYLDDRFPPPPIRYPFLWEESYRMPGAWNVVSLGVLDGYLYAGVEGKEAEIHRSADGRHWSRVARTEAVAVYGLTKFKGAYFAGGNEPAARIFRSEEGRKWKEAARLPGQEGVLSLGIFGDALYAGTNGGEVYRSEDGLRWERVFQFPTRGEPNWVRTLVEFHGRFFAVAEQGDMAVTRDGRRWRPVAGFPASTKETRRLRPAAVFQDTLYVGTTSHGEIWKTRDGEKWEVALDVTPGKRGGYVGSLKAVGEALYAGISVGFGSGRVYRTLDGRDWEEIGLISPHTIEALESFEGTIYAGTLTPPDTRIFRGIERSQISEPAR